MDGVFNDNFKDSLLTGFIDKSLKSDALYQPELLVNRNIPRKKVQFVFSKYIVVVHEMAK